MPQLSDLKNYVCVLSDPKLLRHAYEMVLRNDVNCIITGLMYFFVYIICYILHE